MAKIESGPMKEDLAKVGKGLQEAMQRIAAASPAWNATLRTTCVATLLEGGHAMNALPQLATATVNCRVLPEDSVDRSEEHTSELQSRLHLVCRLLLEKKKQQRTALY